MGTNQFDRGLVEGQVAGPVGIEFLSALKKTHAKFGSEIEGGTCRQSVFPGVSESKQRFFSGNRAIEALDSVIGRGWRLTKEELGGPLICDQGVASFVLKKFNRGGAVGFEKSLFRLEILMYFD